MTTQNQNNIHDSKIGIGKIILTILAIVFVLFFFMGLANMMKAMYKKPEVKKKPRPVIAVMVAPAVTKTVQLNATVQGESRPRTEIDLVPEVGGKIISVSPKFISGGIFNKGDVLYRIDPTDYEVAVVRAEAGVARAKQVLLREEKESEIAKQDWQDLGEGKVASDLTLRKPQLREAQANLQSAEADLQNAKIRLARTEVKAPFNGRVREKIADIGQYVGPGTRLGRIFSTDIAEVRLAISDEDLAQINLPFAYVAKNRRTAPQVELTATVGGIVRTWHGRIMRTDAAFDPQTRSMYAIAEVVDPYGKGAAKGGFPLAPGLFVDAKISGKTLKDVIVIPRDGLRPENQVYIVTPEGVAEAHTASVIDTNPERAILSSGIKPGDYVIVSPLEKSQISLKFRALDYHDPSKILIEPKKEETSNTEKEVMSVQAAKAKAKEAKMAYINSVKKLKKAKKAAKANGKKKKHKQGKPKDGNSKTGAGQ